MATIRKQAYECCYDFGNVNAIESENYICIYDQGDTCFKINAKAASWFETIIIKAEDFNDLCVQFYEYTDEEPTEVYDSYRYTFTINTNNI